MWDWCQNQSAAIRGVNMAARQNKTAYFRGYVYPLTRGFATVAYSRATVARLRSHFDAPQLATTRPTETIHYRFSWVPLVGNALSPRKSPLRVNALAVVARQQRCCREAAAQLPCKRPYSQGPSACRLSPLLALCTPPITFIGLVLQ